MFVYNFFYKTDVPTGRHIYVWEHFCLNIMASDGVSRMGKTNMIFIDPGPEVNSSYYCRSSWERVCCLIFKQGVHHHVRLIRSLTDCKWTYQQDGAPVHTARNTTDYLKKEKIDFIEPDMWPPNSIVNRIKIGDVCGPHVRRDEINLLFLQIICGITYCVNRCTILLKCPFVLATYCLHIRQQTHFQDESKMLRQDQ